MVIRNYHWRNSASRVLISTYSAPLVQAGECPQQTDSHTHGRYQTYYLPCYAVDKNFYSKLLQAYSEGMVIQNYYIEKNVCSLMLYKLKL